MTGTRISDMDLKPTIEAGDLVPIVSGGDNYNYDLGEKLADIESAVDGLIITPFMFGASEDAIDNSAALQAWNDYIMSHTCRADWTGTFEVQNGFTLGLEYGAAFSDVGCRTISGRITLRVTANIDGPVINNQLPPHCEVGLVAIGPLEDQLDWDNRLYDTGILFQDRAQMQLWKGGEIGFARLYGLFVQTGHGAADNTFANNLGTWFFYGCGSGAAFGATPQAFASSGYTSLTRNGSSADLAQTSTVAVTTQPPAIATDGDYAVTLYAHLDGEYHRVTATNPGAGTITLFPWHKTTTAGSGTIQYCFGGGAAILGGDAGVQQLGDFTSSACATGFHNGALYPGDKMHVTAQGCAIGHAAGQAYGQAVVGGDTSIYCEGNDVDFLWSASQTSGPYTISSEHALDLSKFLYFRPRNTDNTFVKGGMPTRLNINFDGRWHHLENLPDSSGSHEIARISLDRAYHEVVPLYSNSPTIVIQEVATYNGTSGLSYGTAFGYFARQVSIVGTGANGQPTGTVAVDFDLPAFASHTMNGGAAGVGLTFTGFTRPALISIMRDSTNPLNWIVKVLSGRPLTGTVTWDPASIAAGARELHSVTVPGAALGDCPVAGFSVNIGALEHWVRVTAPDTVNVTLYNPTASPIDLGSMTVTVRLV